MSASDRPNEAALAAALAPLWRSEEIRGPIAEHLATAGPEVRARIAKALLAEGSPAEGDTPPVFVSLASLQADPKLLAPPECVLPKIAYRGRLTIFAGADKSGKSTFLAYGSGALTRGDRFLGEYVSARHGRVVWVGLEEALGDEVRRFTDFNAEGECVQLVVGHAADLLSRTRALLEEWPADLVVVDSLAECARVTMGHAPEDGDNAGWGALVRPWVALAREADVAVVVLHHVRRSDGQARGASEILAAADCVLEMAQPKSGEDPTVRHVTGRARWAVEPFSVHLQDGRYELHAESTVSLDVLLYRHIDAAPGSTVSGLRDAVGSRKEHVIAALNRLEDRHMIENRGSDRRSAYYVVGEQTELEAA